MLLRNLRKDIPVILEALLGRPVGYRFALNFQEAGVLIYDGSPPSSAVFSPSACGSKD